jgi:formylglycine-generating enzyme required for sulfatase activity
MRPTEKIKQYIKNVKIKTNPKVNQAVLDDLLDRLDAAQGTKKHPPRPNIWRMIMENRTTKLTTAAAAVLIAGAVIFSLFISPGVTFADVIKPILEAKTFAYDMHIGGEDGPVMHDLVSGNRIRRTMSDMPGMVLIIDTDAGKLLRLDTAGKNATLINISGEVEKGGRNYIALLRETINRQMANPNVAPKEQFQRQIDGRKVIGYSIGNDLKGNDRDRVTILADEKTGTPVQIEIEWGQETFILKNLGFNIPIPEEDVSLAPPAGYKMQKTDMDLSKLSDKDLIESLRVWAKYLRDGTFPPELLKQEYIKQIPAFRQKIGSLPIPDAEKEKMGNSFLQGMFFLQTCYTSKMDFHYAGAGVKLGDAGKAIFWYRPKDAKTYRVIYGDLSVKDVAPENLPNLSKLKEIYNNTPQIQFTKSFEPDMANTEDKTKNKNSSGNKPVIEFVDIPAGTFMMGSPATEQGREADEVQHQVTLSAFKMSKYPVTYEQYDVFCEATGRTKPWGFNRGNLPVVQVTWHDANAFAEWMGCRLPTEAEWEYAARANTTTPFNTGDCLTSEQANFNGEQPYADCEKGKNINKPLPVGSFPPNAFGLYDMHGNIWEWCNDWYGEYDIKDKLNPQGPDTGTRKINRGGGWYDPAWRCRSAYRGGGDPPGNRGQGISFRLVKSE